MKTIVLSFISHAFNSLKVGIFSQKPPLTTTEYALFFSQMNGSGRVSCGDCGFTQRLISLMYITKNGDDTTCRGYQCQSCGIFKEVSYEGNLATSTKSSKKIVYSEIAETCGCGGVLEREKKLFCPHCQSNHLSYECIFRTK